MVPRSEAGYMGISLSNPIFWRVSSTAGRPRSNPRRTVLALWEWTRARYRGIVP